MKVTLGGIEYVGAKGLSGIKNWVGYYNIWIDNRTNHQEVIQFIILGSYYYMFCGSTNFVSPT